MKRAFMILAAMAIVVIAAGMATSASSGAPQAAQDQVTAAPIITTEQLTFSNGSQNFRDPAVGEDSKGNRLVIFRGPEGTQYHYTYCPKGGTWSTPRTIGTQPSLERSLYAYIRVDKNDRFHCEWEKPAVYASFKDGVWTTPVKVRTVGSYDLTSGMDVRSDGDPVFVDCEIQGYVKDLWFRPWTNFQFPAPKNLTRDPLPASAQPCVAVDADDNNWVVWKSDYFISGIDENLVIFLAKFDKNGGDWPDMDWMLVSVNPGWAFLPQVAVNSDGKVMSEWAQSTTGQYLSRLYDPKTKTLSSIMSLDIGLCRNPWHSFWSKMTARGKDFFVAAVDAGRGLYLMKFNEAQSKWEIYAKVERAVDMMSIANGNDRMLIAWSTWEEPVNIFLTSIEVPPLSKKLTIEAGTGGTTNPVPGTYTQNVNSSVTVTATPNTGYRFGSWTGDVTGNTPSITITMDRDISVKANFVEQPLLTVQSTLGGTTTPVPGSYRYDKGASVTVTSAPNTNYEFTGWTGDVTGTATSITFNLDRDMTVNANYALQPVLTVQSGSGGTTNPVPGTYHYNKGTQVSIRAVPDAAYLFANWTGDVTDTAYNPATVTVDRDKTIKGNFALKVQSPINLAMAKRTERGFFNARYLNIVTWQANPLNAERGVSVTHQRIYRKTRTADNSQWTRIAEVSASTLNYEDRYVTRDDDYVYAVSCVDSYGNESLYY